MGNLAVFNYCSIFLTTTDLYWSLFNTRRTKVEYVWAIWFVQKLSISIVQRLALHQNGVQWCYPNRTTTYDVAENLLHTYRHHGKATHRARLPSLITNIRNNQSDVFCIYISSESDHQGTKRFKLGLWVLNNSINYGLFQNKVRTFVFSISWLPKHMVLHIT